MGNDKHFYADQIIHQMHAEPLEELTRSVVYVPERTIEVEHGLGLERTVLLRGDDRRETDRPGCILDRQRTGNFYIGRSGGVCGNRSCPAQFEGGRGIAFHVEKILGFQMSEQHAPPPFILKIEVGYRIHVEHKPSRHREAPLHDNYSAGDGDPPMMAVVDIAAGPFDGTLFRIDTIDTVATRGRRWGRDTRFDRKTGRLPGPQPTLQNRHIAVSG